ncbi:Sucrose transport protein SUC5 [Morella rubra]|uniref:Sucrose transport protein SUC5 n=1 Tax=Morella rubra TaxID=262757 RepID=A0A6A1W6B7_9ROSI|nr:Sucrose transport protein SUC5 [Morella rubra]
MEAETASKNIVQPSPLSKIILVASIAAGVQFGWALQLSLLTPYVQLLGIPHTWAAFIWLCGPISGMLVQPIVGYHSDRCASRFGRRRPFIAAGSSFVAVAVFLIGYSADLGHLLGDHVENAMKPRAIAFFVVGFWILDVSNNMLQGPCRALLADLSGKDQKRTRTANAFFSFFMAVGNILGFAAGSYTHLYKRNHPGPLYSEVRGRRCRAETSGLAREHFQGQAYWNVSELVRGSSSCCRTLIDGEGGVRGIAGMGVLGHDRVDYQVVSGRHGTANLAATAVSRLARWLFRCWAYHLVTYSIPFALASIFSNTSGAGQGLSLGVLNLAIVVPQMLVSVASGPWDDLFGGGNLPAFVVGAVAATASGILALTMLPSPTADLAATKTAVSSAAMFH